MKNNLSFSIVIPNYNGAKFLKPCLESLISSISKLPNSSFEIILIDNGSTDNSPKISSNFFKNLKSSNITYRPIIHLNNTGVAPAFSEGIQIATYDWVVLLNNDIIIDKNWFTHIADNINKRDSKTVVFFGTILNKDGTKIESQGLDFFYKGRCLNINNGLPYLRSKIFNLRSTPVWGASAANTVYHKETILKIGNFDSDFFAYEEDVDLSLRLFKLGYKTIYVPKAISYHHGGATSNLMGNFRHRMDAKNWFFIIIKNYTAKEFLTNLPQIIIERLRNLSGLIKNTPKSHLLSDIFSTYSEMISKIPAMLQKRRQLQLLLK